jgi:hypothetical protein
MDIQKKAQFIAHFESYTTGLSRVADVILLDDGGDLEESTQQLRRLKEECIGMTKGEWHAKMNNPA